MSTLVVDTDVHPAPRSVEELRSYLRPPWDAVPDSLRERVLCRNAETIYGIRDSEEWT